MSAEGADLIVSELLSELKNENERKDTQIHSLHRVLIIVVSAAFLVALLITAGFLIYLNQYDFSSTTAESIANSAEGVYAIIDSDGNVISSDLTAEEIEALLQGVTTGG